MLAATVRVTRDLDLAEECVQDAYAKALTSWRESIPANPAAWLTTTARNRAVDVLRRQSTLKRSLPLLLEPAAGEDQESANEVPDDRLRLIFTCCHPALAQEAQVALTLRLLCGLSVPEIARAFLVGETAMAARITRAKKKIAEARIPYRIPPLEEIPQRIDAVLTVVHLLFTTGHTAPAGAQLVRRDLIERSLDLARMLRSLMPSDPNVAGLLALILLNGARRDARMSDDGQMLLLSQQDRSRWDRRAIDEGIALVKEALRPRPPGRYGLMAAIAAVHDRSPSWEQTDWAQIVALYDTLIQIWPSPVVALNRAVAVGFADGPAAGLAALDALADEPRLAGYAYLAASRADFLRSLGRIAESRTAYEEALLLTENHVERAFLEGRLNQLPR